MGSLLYVVVGEFLQTQRMQLLVYPITGAIVLSKAKSDLAKSKDSHMIFSILPQEKRLLQA